MWNKANIVGASCLAAVIAGSLIIGVSIGRKHSDDGTLQVLSCVDTGLQETVFSQDYILSASSEYDVWVMKLEDSRVLYVQPSGVVCKLQPSVMAIENSTGG